MASTHRLTVLHAGIYQGDGKRVEVMKINSRLRALLEMRTECARVPGHRNTWCPTKPMHLTDFLFTFDFIIERFESDYMNK